MFKFPYTNLHELNLDWILEKVKHFAELIPPMETAVDDVQALQTDVEQAVEDANQALENAGQALETAEEAKEIAEQAAQGTIADGAVTTAKIADHAVTGNKIDLATIQTGNLSEGCVTSNKILDGTIDTVDLNNGAVTNAKIADNSVTQAKLDPDLFALLSNPTTEYTTFAMSLKSQPCYCYRYGNVIFLFSPNDFTSLPSGYTVIGTVPERYRPSSGEIIMPITNPTDVTRRLFISVKSGGDLTVYNGGSAYTSATSGAFVFVYIVNPS